MHRDFAEETASWDGITPIEAKCVEAALELRRLHLPGWRSSVAALSRMRDEMSEMTRSNILGKAAAVNDVYNAQVGSAVLGLADYIYQLSSQNELEHVSESPAALVELIGFRGDISADRTGYQVFASKYAHFFIDPERFPVYDKYAARALLFHWGSFESRVMNGKRRYRHFCHVLDRVVDASDLHDVSLADLDAYLWLAGVYREWLRRGDAAEVNAEVKGFFSGYVGDDDIQGLLAELTPQGPFTESLPHARISP